jgi:hypothetical protein
MALALQEYEDSTCSGCGQPLSESMDPDLAEEWTGTHPHRCGGCTALAVLAEQNKDAKHPHALRYVIGLREGWQERKARLVAARAERAASNQ